MIRVQSFGAGVQSVTLLHMALRNEIERPDLVIFADTKCEPAHVYRVVERDQKACEKAGLPFAVVFRSNLADAPFDEAQVRVPLFTRAPNGDIGMLFRTCTDKHKVAPIRQELRRRGVKKAELWLGMTVDEITRVKPSAVGWITNRYPFIELGMRRGDCEAFLDRHGIEAAKSACVFCPYRSATMWRAVKAIPDDWEAAVAYDASIRDVRPGYKCFVHRSCTPLSDAIIDDEPSLFDDECLGVCAV